ncbi:unnamed protein product [Hermetia illucens]|uniref:Uncharacterized protein n=1 Tax=Hermetia illucens TaxID=343691 RepID=A0A7R8UKL5_HERIL|nr:unnamed protein product [Hermetia illucens]
MTLTSDFAETCFHENVLNKKSRYFQKHNSNIFRRILSKDVPKDGTEYNASAHNGTHTIHSKLTHQSLLFSSVFLVYKNYTKLR